MPPVKSKQGKIGVQNMQIVEFTSTDLSAVELFGLMEKIY